MEYFILMVVKYIGLFILYLYKNYLVKSNAFFFFSCFCLLEKAALNEESLLFDTMCV